MNSKSVVLRAVREAYPEARVWWTGDSTHGTVWITETHRERCISLRLDEPDLSNEELVENVLDALS